MINNSFLIIQLLNEKNYANKRYRGKNTNIFTFCQSELDHPKWGVIKNFEGFRRTKKYTIKKCYCNIIML